MNKEILCFMLVLISTSCATAPRPTNDYESYSVPRAQPQDDGDGFFSKVMRGVAHILGGVSQGLSQQTPTVNVNICGQPGSGC